VIHLVKDIPPRVKLLWAAVLRRAVFDYVLYKGCGEFKMEWQYAFNYVFTEDQEYDNGYSFEEVCAMFNWDPDYLRRMTTKLTRSDIKRLETSSFKGDFFQKEVEISVKETGSWTNCRCSLPFYPRMLSEFTAIQEPAVVRKHSQIHKVPLVSWQVAAYA
jgi:hypothetical protein